jgi:hypothetical protein
MMRRMTEPTQPAASWWKQTYEAFSALRKDYHWPTELVTVSLVALTLLAALDVYIGSTLAQQAGLAEGHWAVRLEKTLTSDPFRMLLTLLIALFVGIVIKRQQTRGKIGGADDYSIGRALAYGYFKNFLVGALLAVQARGGTLHVFRPASVRDLQDFEQHIWPALQNGRQTRVVEAIDATASGSKPLKRRVIVIEGFDASGLMYFDFPTTLFTVADYFAVWNQWLIERERPPIAEDALPGYHQKQIDDFFNELDKLVHSDFGLNAVKEFGLSSNDLRQLFKDRLREISLPQLRELVERSSSLTP